MYYKLLQEILFHNSACVCVYNTYTCSQVVKTQDTQNMHEAGSGISSLKVSSFAIASSKEQKKIQYNIEE